MSRGTGSGCVRIYEDDEKAVYSYYCYDLNVQCHAYEDRIIDGRITVMKHEDSRLYDGTLAQLIDAGTVIIENSTNAWAFSDGIDLMALPLCVRIIKCVQKEGSFPERCGYHV